MTYENHSVGNIAHIHFAATVFSLPLKIRENPHGIYSEHELYSLMAITFVAIFFDLDPAKSFPLRLGARAVTQQLGKLIEANVKTVNATSWVKSLVDPLMENRTPLVDYGVHMTRKLLESGLGPHEIAWSQILPTSGTCTLASAIIQDTKFSLVAMVANQAQVVSVQASALVDL